MVLNKIEHSDVLEFLHSLPDESVNTIVTSPPYNKGYWSKNRNMGNGFHTKARRIEYECFNDCMAPADYEKWQREILFECKRVIKQDGSIFYNHIDILCGHTTFHPTFVYDFPLKQIIIWNRGNTPKLDKSYFFPTIEYVFWLKKDQTSKPKFYKNKAVFNKVIWDIKAERENAHPAPFPVELAYNCIISTCDKGDIVLDCFMGSGTTAIAAALCKCNYIGCDNSEEYVEMANKRIALENAQLQLF